MKEAPLAVVTHGWACLPNWIWIPDTKAKLENVGFEVITPRMYRLRPPFRQEWIDNLDLAVNGRENVTIIAHSCSGRSALHYVEENTNVRNLVVVSAFVDCIGDEMEEQWRDYYSKPLDTEVIKKNCPNILGLYSEDDEVIPYSQADLFEQRLGSVVRFIGQGHFLAKQLPIDLIPYLK